MHNKSIEEIIKDYDLNTHTGLSDQDVKKKQSTQGFNTFAKETKIFTKGKIFFEQWKSPLIFILAFAGVVSLLLGEVLDAIVITITIAINILIGYFQENKANNALGRLRKMVEYKTQVLRNGEKQYINSKELCVGDIIFVEAGDKVQADARIIDVKACFVKESALTGESDAIEKTNDILPLDTVVAERHNMLHSGTTVVEGKASAIVTAIGKNTELGKIASLVHETKEEKTPLQLQLAKLSKKISIIVAITAFLILIGGTLFSNDSFIHLFETAVAVAVAAIPEGLVISLTVLLAIGMQSILKSKALVRKLVAAETLGSVNVICTDKTGTITEGVMRLTHIYTPSGEYAYRDLQRFLKDKKYPKIVNEILKIGSLCNNAIIDKSSENIKYLGDTTETAIVEYSDGIGLSKNTWEKNYPRLDEIPFNSKEKFMATLHKGSDHKNIIAIKGAPDILLAKCIFSSDEEKNLIEHKIKELAGWGLRLLLIASKTTPATKLYNADIHSLTFHGLLALSDPIREDVKQTLEIAHTAGIRVIMITGDHAITAKSIASKIGLPSDEKNIIDGKTFATMNKEEIIHALSTVSVFARVSPNDKIKIVQALKSQGHVVSMTGDGVNDAPALKGADIGVALGSGTDVAKDISDMVLLNDKFSTIVKAVKEGRAIYENIKKVVVYLLAGSFSEVVMIIASMVAGLPLAALPAQILWINLIQDSFPNLALAFDKANDDIMNDKPRKKDTPLLDGNMKKMIFFKSFFSNIALFIIFYLVYKQTQDIVLTRTLVFTGFAVDSMLFIFSVRNLRRMIWQYNPFNNYYLIAATFFGAIMLLLAIYWHPLQILLRTVPLDGAYWILMLSFGIFNLFLMEILKYFFIIKKNT